MEITYKHEAAFEEFLNDCAVGGVVKICGYEYGAARAFKLVDPIAYHQEYHNWADAEFGDEE